MIVFTPVGSRFFALKYTKKDSTLYYYYLTLTGCYFCLFVVLGLYYFISKDVCYILLLESR